MATISTSDKIRNYPFANVVSIADSPKKSKSTGTIYFFLTSLDFTAQDLMRNNHLTLLLSMDEDAYCTKKGVDPMEPTCPRIIISGSAERLENGTNEYKFGNQSMFSRHPAAAGWVQMHSFFLCKLEIEQIVVLDFYGGAQYVTPEEYYKANYDGVTTRDAGFGFEELGNEISNDLTEADSNNNDGEREIHIKIKKNTDVRVINIEI